MTEQDVWNANKKAITTYAAANKKLKLIWERDPKTERIIRMFQSLRELGTEDSLSFSFGGRVRTFYVLNIPTENIPLFQQRVSGFGATPEFTSVPQSATNSFKAERELAGGNLIRPLELLLIEVEMFWSPIPVTAGSRNSRRPARF